MSGLQQTRFLAKKERRRIDLEHRERLNSRFAIETSKKEVDGKAEQLKAIAEIATVLAGFTIASLVNIDFNDTNTILLCVYSVCAALTICFLIFAAVTSSYLLISVYKYDVYKTNIERFDQYWANYCEEDWKSCFMYLVLGVLLFVMVLIELSWITSANHRTGVIISSIVTVAVSLGTFLWYTNIYFKWSEFLQEGGTKYRIPQLQQEREQEQALRQQGQSHPPSSSSDPHTHPHHE